MSNLPQEYVIRFLEKIKFSWSCWEWTGGQNGKGYGQFRTPTKSSAKAHRVAYEYFVGPIEDGMVLDHLCRNRCCVRPDHLEPVTSAENTRRGMSGKYDRSHLRPVECIRGHAFEGENLIISKDGSYRCRECKNMRAREYRVRKAAG